MAEVVCPVGDCEYSGPVKSVEAHISRLQRDGHQGEVGRAHREGLLAQAEGRDTAETTSESVEEQGEATTEESSESVEVEGIPVPSTAVVVGAVVVVALLALAIRAGSSGGATSGAVEETGQPDEQESTTGPDRQELFE